MEILTIKTKETIPYETLLFFLSATSFSFSVFVIWNSIHVRTLWIMQFLYDSVDISSGCNRFKRSIQLKHSHFLNSIRIWFSLFRMTQSVDLQNNFECIDSSRVWIFLLNTFLTAVNNFIKIIMRFDENERETIQQRPAIILMIIIFRFASFMRKEKKTIRISFSEICGNNEVLPANNNHYT